jgi:Fic family protein
MDKLPENVIRFLHEEYNNQRQGENDFSVLQAADAWGISVKTAKKQILEMLNKGSITEHHGRLLNGSFGAFYRIVED